MSNEITTNINSREYKHQHKERLCHCCDTVQDSKDKINTFSISHRGYGSKFDNCSFEIQLCDKCKEKIKSIWFNESPVIEDYYENYKYEDDIDNFIKTFPIENQEYIYNHMDAYIMDRQDWIDMENGILPDEKYNEYNMYSPSDIQSYEERFTTCAYPINIKYDDNSIGCQCPFGAMGRKDQQIDGNISDECHNCSAYKMRTTPIQTIDEKDFYNFKAYIKGKVAEFQLREKKII